jgi:hypothetical protein
MSSTPTSSNSDKTFTITPEDNLSDSTVFRIRITTGTKDSSGNSLTSQWNTSSGFQTVPVPPILTEVTVVTTPTNDSTPNYTFSSTEAGTITYGGSCSSGITSATSGNNTITLVSLSDETYSNCKITVTDSFGNVSNTLTVTSFIIDSTAATLEEVTSVTTPTNDTTPDYTFSSTEAGTITYGGSCSSSTTSATVDNNTITFVSLSEDTYSDCTITVTDNGSNSVTLNISSFVIDTTVPTVSSIYPTDNQSGVSVTDNVSVTFSESMDNTSVTTNTDNTTCYGSLELSSDNFSSCVQMSSSPTSSNSYKTFTLDPTSNLSYSTTYKIRVTTAVKDTAGNTLSSQYESANGFTTNPPPFVAVGLNGNILTSLDGISWTERTSGTSNDLVSVTYGNSNFVTVGSFGTILTSSDGTSWTERTSGTSEYLYGVTYGEGLFVTVGWGGIILTSSDGTTWTSRTSGTSKNLNGVTFGNNTFMIVGHHGTILSSSDGTTWTTRNTQNNVYYYDITYGNNTFVLVGFNGKIVTSPDGTTWTSRTSGTSEELHAVTYGNSTFMTVSESVFSSSDNGTTWTSRYNDGRWVVHFGVTYGNGLFVTVGGSIFSSSDNGTTWTSRISGTSLKDIIYAD